MDSFLGQLIPVPRNLYPEPTRPSSPKYADSAESLHSTLSVQNKNVDSPTVEKIEFTLVEKIEFALSDLYEQIGKSHDPANRVDRPKGLWDYTAAEVAAFKKRDIYGQRDLEGIGKISQTWKGGDDLFDFTKDPDYLERQIGYYGLTKSTLPSGATWLSVGGKEASRKQLLEAYKGLRPNLLEHDNGVGDIDIQKDFEARTLEKQAQKEAFVERQKKEAKRSSPEKTGLQLVKELSEWLELNRPVQPLCHTPAYKECVEAGVSAFLHARQHVHHGLFYNVHKRVRTSENPAHPTYAKRKAMRVE